MNQTLLIRRLWQRRKAAEYTQERLRLLAVRQCRLSQDWHGKCQAVEGRIEELERENYKLIEQLRQAQYDARQLRKKQRKLEWIWLWRKARDEPGGVEKLDEVLYEFLSWLASDADYHMQDEGADEVHDFLERLGFVPIEEDDL